MADVAESGLLHQLADGLARVEALGIKLIGDDAQLVMDDDFARDQPVAVAGQRALAADEVMLVDPFPRAALEVIGHIGAVGDVEHQLAGGTQDLADGGEHLLVVLLVGEVAERVAHDGDAVEARLRQARVARIAFLEHDLQPLVLRALLGEAHEIARAVDAGDVLEAAARELETVPALAAAQVEDLAVGGHGRRGENEIDVAARVLHVLDDVAVGLDVERVEKFAPPLGGKMRLEVRNGTEARAWRRAPRALRLGNGCHDGRSSSKGRRRREAQLPPSAGDRPNKITGPCGPDGSRTYWPIATLQEATCNFPRSRRWPRSRLMSAH